jgi:hypothetical protein
MVHLRDGVGGLPAGKDPINERLETRSGIWGYVMSRRELYLGQGSHHGSRRASDGIRQATVGYGSDRLMPRMR